MFVEECNQNTTYQNLGDSMKTVVQGKVLAINAYIKKRVISRQQQNISPKELEKVGLNKPKVSIRNETLEQK